MRIHLVSLLALTVVFVGPIQANAAGNTKARAPASGQSLSSIPAEFNGEWRESPAQCGDMTETGLDISAKSLKYYGYTHAMNSIRRAGPRTILVTQTVQRAELGGTLYSLDETTSYEISADGLNLIETDTHGNRISRDRCSNSGTQTAAPRLSPSQEVTVWVTASANVRNHPTTAGSRVLATREAGGLMSGTWVNGDDGSSRWLRVDLAAMEIHSPSSEFGYVWEGNLRLAQKGETSTSSGQTQPAVEPDVSSSSALPQLRTGAYVSFPSRCAQASNATLEWWNGQFFSGGRKHPAYPRAVGPARPNSSQPFVADVKGWEDNKTYRVNFLVLSQSMYERDGLRYFHCSDARLPAAWRNSTPPQAATTTPQSTRSGSEEIAYMDQWHYAALVTFLSQNPSYRMGQASSDFPNWKRVVDEFKEAGDNDQPFYAVGDFNRDRFPDFAVVLVDMNVGAVPRNYRGNESRYYNASVAVFNGSPSGYASRPSFMEKWGFVQSSLLLYSRETNDLMVGQWEGSLAQVKPERGGAYRYYFGE